MTDITSEELNLLPSLELNMLRLFPSIIQICLNIVNTNNTLYYKSNTKLQQK